MPTALSDEFTHKMSKPEAICTIATKGALADLQLWIQSLLLWNSSELHIYILGDNAVVKTVKQFVKRPNVHVYDGLEQYTNHTRQTMAAAPATELILAAAHRSLWDQFQLEKATIMRTALEEGRKNVMFTDSDILFLAPLRPLPVNEYDVILAPHYIRKRDTDKYGYYNGGWMWTRTVDTLDTWRTATCTSRFHEQAALEDVAAKYKCAELPPTENYGWWRMFQSTTTPQEQAAKFSIVDGHICYNGHPLTSVHTHFVGRIDAITANFNRFIMQLMLAGDAQLHLLARYITTAGS